MNYWFWTPAFVDIVVELDVAKPEEVRCSSFSCSINRVITWYQVFRSSTVWNFKSIPPPRTNLTERHKSELRIADSSLLFEETVALYFSGGPAITPVIPANKASLWRRSFTVCSDRHNVRATFEEPVPHPWCKGYSFSWKSGGIPRNPENLHQKSFHLITSLFYGSI